MRSCACLLRHATARRAIDRDECYAHAVAAFAVLEVIGCAR
jgi:hypothetical protein